MGIQSKLIIFSFRDMIDYHALKVNRFRKLNIKFSLQDKLEEVMSMMRFRAQGSDIKINFNPAWQNEQEYQNNFINMIQYQRLKANLQQIDHQVENRPLLQRLKRIDKNKKLPINLIGDPDRLQQVIINLIQNALKNQYEGEIFIKLIYDEEEGQIIIIITDQGSGIKTQDQEQLFKLLGNMDNLLNPEKLQLSDGSHIGMGLVLAKQIVMKNGGTIDFCSDPGVGSTFIFSFDLQLGDSPLIEPPHRLEESQSPKFGYSD